MPTCRRLRTPTCHRAIGSSLSGWTLWLRQQSLRQQYQLLYHPRCNLRSVGFPEEHSVHLSERQPQVRRPRPRAAHAKHPPRGPRHYLRRLFLHARTHAPRCPLRRRSSRAWYAPSMPQRAEPPARPRRVRTPAPCTCQRCPSTAETFPRTRRPS